MTRELSQAQRYMTDMTRHLVRITEACSAGNLPDKLETAEQTSGKTESRLQEEVALLQEMVEEWEQCDKKVKEVTTWVEKAKANLDAPHNKRKSLHEQLVLREVKISFYINISLALD